MHKQTQAFLYGVLGRERERKREKPHTSSELFSSWVSCRMHCHSSRTAEVVWASYFNTLPETNDIGNYILGNQHSSAKCLKILYIKLTALGILYSFYIQYNTFINSPKLSNSVFVNHKWLHQATRLSECAEQTLVNRSCNYGDSSLNRTHWKPLNISHRDNVRDLIAFFKGRSQRFRSFLWSVQRTDLRASRYFAGTRVQVAAEYRVICETILLQEVRLFFVAGQWNNKTRVK